MPNSVFLFPGGIAMRGDGSISFPQGIQIGFPDGTITLPGIAFAAEFGTGFYRQASGTVRYTAGGVDGVTFTALGVGIPAGGRFRSEANGSKMTFPADGRVLFLDNAGTTDSQVECLRISTSSASPMLRSRTTLTNGAGASAGTLTNAPSVGNPTKWIAIDDNGTTRQIPCW